MLKLYSSASALLSCGLRLRRGIIMEQASIALEKIIAQSLRKVPAGEAPVMAWPVVCGSGVAERTRALSFCEGILRVEVSDAGWKSELQSLAPRYVAMLNRYSSEKVQRVEFVVAYPESAGRQR